MITLNCNDCQDDGNCVCSDLRERKRTSKIVYVSESYITLNKILSGVSLGGLWKDAKFEFRDCYDGCLLWLEYKEADIDTGEMCIQKTREWYISGKSTESEVLRTIHKLLLGSMEHRLDEHLTYQGRRIYDPHRPVAKE